MAMAPTPREQVDLRTWRERLSESFVRLDVLSLRSDDYLRTRMSTAVNGWVRASTVDVRGEPHVVRRSRARTTDDGGALLVSVQLGGTCVVRQGGREAFLEPGDIAVYCSSEPYDLAFPGGTHRQAVLQVPLADTVAMRSLLGKTAVRVPGSHGLGRAVGPLITAIPRAIENSNAVEAERLTLSGLDLLALSLSSGDRISRSAELLDRARAFIAMNADDPSLTPPSIAVGVHLSLAHLHRVFQQSDNSVAETVKNIRLERAAADLRDEGLREWTIAEIAERRGFADASSFSRAFASRFGMPPIRWRNG